MSQPDQPRPVPGPAAPRTTALPGPAAVPGPRPDAAPVPGPGGAPRLAPTASPSSAPSPFAGLSERPVSEHVAVFEAEHDRLQRELATIDQL